MAVSIVRDTRTWLCYLLLAYFGFMLNILGPLTPFLKDDLNLTYTVSSLHFTAFAVGILLVGFFGNPVIVRLGRWRTLWWGAFGMSLGAFLLIAGRASAITIAGAFLMGVLGSFILAGVPAVLTEIHGAQRAVTLSEANVIASLASAFAPLVVGWAAALPGGWRLSLGLAAVVPVLLRLLIRKDPPAAASSAQNRAGQKAQTLPALYWLFWLLLTLGVAVEFCTIFWSADFMETSLGLSREAAAQWVSVFLVGMIIGRLAGSRLVERFPAQRVVFFSILLAGVGFAAYWSAVSPVISILGLWVAGLGVANFYPLLLSLAIGAAREAVDQASARAALASGVAILSLPLLLGRIADGVGIRTAYGLVAVLLAVLFLLMSAAVTRGWKAVRVR